MIAAALAWMQIPPRQPARAVPLGRYRAILSGSVARISAVGFALGRVSCRNGQEGTPKAARNAAGARRRRRHPPVLATLLQVSPERVARWRTIPAEYAVVIEAKIGLPRER